MGSKYSPGGYYFLEEKHTPYLALDERAQEHKYGDSGPHDEVQEVPQSQASHLPQCHLLHLEAQPIPLASQLPLKADENHLQCFTVGKEKHERASHASETRYSYSAAQPHILEV